MERNKNWCERRNEEPLVDANPIQCRALFYALGILGGISIMAVIVAWLR